MTRPRGRPKDDRRVVLFLGAGASAAFGYPVTSAVFPRIREGLKTRKLFPIESNPKRERAKMRRLRAYLEKVLPGFVDDQLALPLITDVLSLIDLLLETGETALPMMSANELEDFRTLVEEALIQVIDAGVVEASQDPALDRLADWIVGHSDDGGAPVAVISTNYDTLVETAVFRKLESRAHFPDESPLPAAVDFGFAWREHATGTYLPAVHHPPASPQVRMYKLHGSLSWLRCALCGFVYVNTTGNVIGQAFREDKVDYNNTCVCGHGPVRPVLVAPSLIRSVRDPNLLTIWRSALDALRQADEWVIAGYSLPPEDVAIRSILLRGFHARGKNRQPPTIRYVQREEDSATDGRYRLLFPGAKPEYGGFGAFIESSLEPRRHYETF